MLKSSDKINAEIGKIKIVRHHWSKNVRLHVKTDGTVVATAPKFAPTRLIHAAIYRHKKWIETQRNKMTNKQGSLIVTGSQVGRHHIMQFVKDEFIIEVKSRIKLGLITIKLPPDISWDDPEAQQQAKKAQIKVLRDEAEEYLPGRLGQLAEQHGYTYNSVRIRKLERRWGSCTQNKDITFNLQLMNLPDELVDYVIMHELAHTRHLHHQAGFWDEMRSTTPRYQNLRKQLRNYQV